MKLAYFSPLGPQRSGISDYSEELLPHLAVGAEITLFVEGFHPSNRDLTSRFEVIDYRRRRAHLRELDRFDAVVYHMGNDHRYHSGIFDAMKQRSGIVVFHDFALQEFFLGLARNRNDLKLYLNEVEACHGKEARNEAAKALATGATPPIMAQAIEFPLNRMIAGSAEGIIVHSEWSRSRFATAVPHVPIARISMPVKLPDASRTRDSSGPVVSRRDTLRLCWRLHRRDSGLAGWCRDIQARRHQDPLPERGLPVGDQQLWRKDLAIAGCHLCRRRSRLEDTVGSITSRL